MNAPTNRATKGIEYPLHLIGIRKHGRTRAVVNAPKCSREQQVVVDFARRPKRDVEESTELRLCWLAGALSDIR